MAGIVIAAAFLLFFAAAYVSYGFVTQRAAPRWDILGGEPKPRREIFGKLLLDHNITTVLSVILFGALLLLGHYFLALAGILGLLIAKEYAKAKSKREITENLPATINILNRSLRAGLTVSQALESIVTFSNSAGIKNLFRRINQRAIITGRTPCEITQEEAKKNSIPELVLFSSILEAYRAVGGNVVEVLGIFEEQLRQTMISRKKISSLMAESKMSIVILGLIPIVIFAAVFNMAPDYLQFFLSKEGRVGLVLVAGFYVAGVALSYMLAKGR